MSKATTKPAKPIIEPEAGEKPSAAAPFDLEETDSTEVEEEEEEWCLVVWVSMELE